MFRLHVIQARYGDCLLLEFGTSDEPHYVLVDGGPPRTYERHLRGELARIAAQQGATTGHLELVVLSHVDNDHVVGLLDLTSELREQRANQLAELVQIDALWHNAFDDTIGRGSDLEVRLESLGVQAMAASGQASMALSSTGIALQGIGEGRQLRRDAMLLGIPINDGFPDDLVTVDTAPETIPLGDLTLRVVGPTLSNLEELQEEWEEWLEEHADDVTSGDPMLAAAADRSIPNLSSIMLLAQVEVDSGTRTILFTGDGRGDHLLQGLRRAGLLDHSSTLHVDVLKVAHHGSERNSSRRFYRKVTADTYVISADGLHGNPDLATLIWIVEGAREDQRPIEILVTNKTPSTKKLLEEYPADDYGYRLVVLDPEASALTVDLVPPEEEEVGSEHK
jgi:glyoxylase-like metal-dependent hydrolase (beta-lactamase superfamily II)